MVITAVVVIIIAAVVTIVVAIVAWFVNVCFILAASSIGWLGDCT
jgi:hypothetical protein